MGRVTPWEDEYTLLCERCGYVIEGLDASGNCPECGKAIAESLPGRRVGTPWQRRGTIKSVVPTAIRTLTHPLNLLGTLRCEEDERVMSLRQRYAIAAGLGVTTGVIQVAGPFVRSGPEGAAFSAPTVADLFVLVPAVAFVTAIVAVAVTLLTIVESRGLVFIGNRRGLRMTPAYASQITHHGSIGWVIAGWSLGVSIALASIAYEFGWRLWDSARPDETPLAILATGCVGAFGGFLFFEVFAWLGLRRCKFANRVRPATAREPKGDSPS